MKILQCMASMDAAKGGPTNAAVNLAGALGSLGHTVTTLSHDDGHPGGGTQPANFGIQHLTFPLTLSTWEYSRGYVKWLEDNIAKFDLVIVHSVFLAHAFFAARYARKAGVPYVLRPHGSYTNSDMAKNRRLKLLYLKSVDRRTVADAEYLFCTSEAEALETSALMKSGCRTIPLGVSDDFLQAERSMSKVDRKEVVFVGRIAPKKGVDLLVEAVSQLRREGSKVTLTLYGPEQDKQLAQQIRGRISRDGLEEAIKFGGFIDKSQQVSVYCSAGIFALPSTHENFGISAAEALSTGLPAVLSPGVSHSDLPHIRSAARIVPRDASEIAAAIKEIAMLPDADYETMSRSARQLAEQNFSWERAANSLLAAGSTSQEGSSA